MSAINFPTDRRCVYLRMYEQYISLKSLAITVLRFQFKKNHWRNERRETRISPAATVIFKRSVFFNAELPQVVLGAFTAFSRVFKVIPSG